MQPFQMSESVPTPPGLPIGVAMDPKRLNLVIARLLTFGAPKDALQQSYGNDVVSISNCDGEQFEF